MNKMPEFKLINSDQGHQLTHYVQAPDMETAIERFKSTHYGNILECEQIAVHPTPPAEPSEQPVTLSNVKDQSGVSTEWLKVWEQIEMWYGDIKRRESAEEILKRLQAAYFRPSEPVADAEAWLKGRGVTCARCQGDGFLSFSNFTETTQKQECPECDGTGLGVPDGYAEVLEMLQSYARHASARAVESERQRLARLVDEEMASIRKDLAANRETTPLTSSDIAGNFGLTSELVMLTKVRSWLAGEGENA